MYEHVFLANIMITCIIKNMCYFLVFFKPGTTFSSLSPLTHMTSFDITPVSLTENEERPRMRRRPLVRGKKEYVTTRCSSSVCSHHEESATLNGKQHRRLFYQASSPTNTELDWKHTQVYSDCPPEFPQLLLKMSVGSDFGNPLRKFKLVFLGEQSGKTCFLLY